MERKLWLFISGQLPEGTTGPCAAEMRLENSNKGTLKSSQRPLMWPSSPPLLHLVVSSPYCVPYFAAAGVQTCQALPLHMFSSVPPKSNDSFCAQSCWRYLQEAVE